VKTYLVFTKQLEQIFFICFFGPLVGVTVLTRLFIIQNCTTCVSDENVFAHCKKRNYISVW